MTESHFDWVNRLEEENFQKNKAQYPEHIIVLEDCEKLYRKLLNEVIDLRVATREEAHVGQALKVCSDLPNELTLAVLSLFREHIDDSHFHLRKAIEAFGFAGLISKSEEDARKWINAGNGEEAYKEFKEAFKTKRILPRGDAKMDVLFQEYDHNSKHAHSSVFSVQGHVKEVKVGGGKRVLSGPFSTDLNPLRFKQQAVGLAITHCFIMTLLLELFEKFISPGALAESKSALVDLQNRIRPLNDEINQGFGLK